MILLLPAKMDGQKSDNISVTVDILKKTPDTRFVKPKVTFLDNSAGCSIRNEDGWTAETPAEYYFTVNVPASNATGPTVLVDMKGTEVRRIIMPGQPDAEYEMIDGKLKIALVKKASNIRHLWSSWTDDDRTDVQFPWNWSERRDGKYVDPEPLYENRNLAHIAYAIGAREVFKEWDITNYLNKNFPGKGDAAAVGYENNFPQQHEDYPPHIHIWFKWPDWRGYNTHIYMDDKGQVTGTWIITPKNERYYPKPGVWQEKKDDEERVVFLLRYTRSGTVEMKKTVNDQVYTLKIKPGDVKNLIVLKDKKPIKSISIKEFDPVEGRMAIQTCDLRTKRMRTESLGVDPDLAGGDRKITETNCR
ncbi:MAG TPA: hypothetical protein VK207_09795 [Bacteroidales bacterium]|nr:hypothetical protein [Bacteroidales bacterium]